jgi:hypothetical protein
MKDSQTLEALPLPDNPRVGIFHRDVVAAQLLFAQRVRSFVKPTTLEKALERYTALPNMLGAHHNEKRSAYWNQAVEAITSEGSPSVAADLLCGFVGDHADVFYSKENAGKEPKLEHRTGKWLGYVSPDKSSVAIHIDSTVADKKSLSSDFHLFLTSLVKQYPRCTHFEAYSWLLETKVADRFFPGFKKVPTEPKDTLMRGALWMQFITPDYGAQQDRLALFTERVVKAQTLSELVSAFPFWPYAIKGNVYNLIYLHRMKLNCV